MAVSLKFYQIYFSPEQVADIYPFATSYYNEKLTKYFENKVIAELVPKTEGYDYIGVCSHALRKKRGDCQIGLKNDLSLSEQKITFSGADVCILTPRSPIHQVFAAARNWHGQAWVEAFGVFSEFLRSKDIKLPNELRFAIYENHFVTRSEIYKQYVKEMLIPAMEFMDSNEVFTIPSNYINLKFRTRPQEAKKVLDLLGMKDYPIGVFILERLFSIWINDKDLKVMPV